MSNQNGKVKEPKVTKKTVEKKPKAPKVSGQRRGRQQIIFEAMDGKPTLPTDIESACQKVKSAVNGAYAKAAQHWFVIKDGKVLPEMTDDAMAESLKWQEHHLKNMVAWPIQQFPEQAKKVAEKQKLPLPKVEKASK